MSCMDCPEASAAAMTDMIAMERANGADMMFSSLWLVVNFHLVPLLFAVSMCSLYRIFSTCKALLQNIFFALRRIFGYSGHMKTDMLTSVLNNLAREDVRVPAVSKATGLSVQWLYQLRGGKIPNPGVKQIQVLTDYFRKAA